MQRSHEVTTTSRVAGGSGPASLVLTVLVALPNPHATEAVKKRPFRKRTCAPRSQIKSPGEKWAFYEIVEW